MNRHNGWMDVMGYIIIQIYGIYMMYIMGRLKSYTYDDWLRKKNKSRQRGLKKSKGKSSKSKSKKKGKKVKKHNLDEDMDEDKN